jgi:polar amino acid transport system substrate-binding protein
MKDCIVDPSRPVIGTPVQEDKQMQRPRLWLGLVGLALALAAPAHAQAQTVKVGIIPATGTADQVPSPGTSFFVDLMQAIATQAGLTIEFHAVPFGRQIAGVVSGELDVGASPFAATDERRALGVEFTKPVAALEDALLIGSGDPGSYASVADLEGEVVGAMAGTIWEAKITDAGASVKTYTDVFDLAPALTSGEIKAALVSSANRYMFEVERPDQRVRFTDAYIPTVRNDGSLVVRKDNAALLEKLDAAIAALKAEGKILPALTEKYRYLMPTG